MNTKSFCWRTSRTAASVVLLRLVNTLAIAVAGCCLNPMHVRAGGVAPLGELAGGLMVPTNATIHEAPGPVPYPVTPAQSVSPSPTNSFQALADDNTSIPPDTHGAIGPNHVMTMLNTQVRIQSRAGTTNYSTVALSSWWTGVGTFTSIFDPRILYDPYENRWIAISAVDANLSTSGILLGASTSSDPTGTWTRQRVKADAAGTAWADFPTVGFNKNWIVVQVNLFSNANNAFLRSQILAFNKTNVFAGGTNRTVINDSTIGGTQMPAVTYDPTTTTIYLLQTWNTIFTNALSEVNGYLRLYTITGTPASPTFTPTSIFPAYQPWAFSPGSVDFAPQSNTTVKIRNADSRIQNVVYRNGSLWCAQTVFLPYTNATRSAVQWWEIATNGVVRQAARIDDSSGINFYAFPSISVNKFGDALVGYSRFSSKQYASANYSFRAFSESPGSIGTDVVLKSGEGPYYKTFGAGANRWGDYSATVVDPVNDSDLWTIQEYAATPVGTGTTDGDGRWGTWWGHIAVVGPANDIFSTATTISSSQGTTNGTNIRATKETGEPNHAGNAGGASIWYNWTAPASGSVTIDTIGSTFSTLLAIYTGSSVGGLTTVASDNGSAGNGASRVVFTAAGGATYRIAVDGFNGAVGEVTLNWIQPSAPIFTTQPRGQTLYQGSDVTFTAVAIGTPNPTYQWRFNASNISAATNASYTVSGVQTNNGGNYTVVASNSSGSVTSTVAVLTVLISQATLSGPLVTNKTFQLKVSQVSSLNYIIQANTNLGTTNWVAVATNAAPFTFTDTALTNYAQRFFRAVYKP